MNKFSRPFYYISLGLIAGITLAFSSYGISERENKVNAPPMILQKPQNTKLPLKDVQRFTNAITQIKNYYVDDITNKDLFENAIRGMLSNLDPHSSYLDAEDFKELTSVTQGEFGGLGIEVTMEQGFIKVITPIDDTPASRAGIKAGDIIVRLDKTPIRGMTLKKAIEKMRGKKGTSLNLTVIREGEQKPLTFEIVRDVIHIQSVKAKVLDKSYGYVRLSHFQVPTAEDLQNSIQQLQKKTKHKLKGIILDLRNNPGGLLDASIEISDLFLDADKLGDNKLIVYTEGRVPGAYFAANAEPGDILKGAPIVVLINQGSASAAEIVAGALQDHKRALLVGKNSFGKGSVQTVLPLDDKTGVKLTTALYFTPSGRSIQARGIKPDIEVDTLTVEKTKNTLLESLSESRLSGHLKNELISEEYVEVDKADNKKSLAEEDYQLYEALNLLKGLVVAKSFK